MGLENAKLPQIHDVNEKYAELPNSLFPFKVVGN